jgi:cytochrome c553
VRLYLNGQLLINNWVDKTSATTVSNSIALTAQQLYTIELDYYQKTNNASVALAWSSPSTPQAIIPQTQLYPFTNPPPSVVLLSPANNASYTASASVTLSADADAPYNPLSAVSFYANSTYLGSVTNTPYTLTATGLSAGSYALTAVATDGSGLASTSAPVNITVAAGSGQPYGLTTNGAAPAFFNMPTTFNGALPALLSLTGVYTNTPNRTPAGGLIPYVPNTPLWSDGAVKSRYLAVPNNGGAITPNEQITYAPTGSWSFPAGTVFVKNFDLVVNATNASVPLRRLETRLLVRDINGAVYGVTYKWRPDNSDADLLTTSSNEFILITNATGVSTQTWYYPSPADCLTCHTPVANYVLGVNTRQLNGGETYPATGVTDNQLRTLNRLGLFNPAIDEGGIPNLEALSSVTNLAASPQQRSRSYLDANCAQCHQPGGTGVTFDARYDTSLANQNITNYPATFSLGYDHACIVRAEDVWRSMIWQRMNTTNTAIQMPPLARHLIDTNGVAALAAWINSLPGTPALAPPVITPNGGSYIGSVSVTLAPPATNASLYYTLDGSLPTTNSFLYAGAFNLFSNATVSANAFEAGYYNSVAASAVFQVQPLYFTAESFLASRQFQLSFSGVTGSNYVLQATTNFVNWTPIATNLALTNVFNLVDPNASNYPFRFYRVQQP